MHTRFVLLTPSHSERQIELLSFFMGSFVCGVGILSKDESTINLVNFVLFHQVLNRGVNHRCFHILVTEQFLHSSRSAWGYLRSSATIPHKNEGFNI
jgi:predicted enzyme involved in methoxymalonyl-ACP biosynthesis